MNPRTPKTILLAVTVAMALLAVVILTLITLQRVHRQIQPELLQQAEIVGVTIKRRVEQALSLGIPFQRLNGMSDFLEITLQDNRGLETLQIQDLEGKTLYVWLRSPQLGNNSATVQTGNGPYAWLHDLLGLQRSREHLRFPIQQDGNQVGNLQLVLDRGYLLGQFALLIPELLITLVVTVFAARELLRLVIHGDLAEGITELNHVLVGILQNDFQARLHGRYHGTVATLARRWNALLNRINTSYQQVQAGQEIIKQHQQQHLLNPELQARLQKLFSYRFRTGSYVTPLPSGTWLRFLLFTLSTVSFLIMAYLTVEGGSLPLSLYCIGFGLGFLVRDVLKTIPRRLLLTGVLLLFLSLLLNSHSSTPLVVIPWIFGLTGLGHGLTLTGIAHYAIASPHRVDDLSLLTAITAGFIVATGVGGIANQWYGLEAVWMITTGLTGTSLLLVLGLPAQTAATPSSRPVSDRIRYLWLAIFGGLLSGVALISVPFLLLPAWAATLGSDPANLILALVALGVGLHSGCGLVARFLNVDLAGMATGVGGFLSGGALIVMILQPTTSTLVVTAFCQGLGQGLSLSGQCLLLRYFHREKAGLLAARLSYLLAMLGGVVGGVTLIDRSLTLFGLLATTIGLIGVLVGGTLLFSTGFLVLGLEPELEE